MIKKVMANCLEAVADIRDGATIMIGGFGGSGNPCNLLDALVARGVKGLTVIANGHTQYDRLIPPGLIRHIIASFPLPADTDEILAVQERCGRGEFDVETLPQGTLAERIRAAGAGIPAFYTPVGAGTCFEEGKETRTFNGKLHLLEHALTADFALIKAYRADTVGNLAYHQSARNFNPIMAPAARVCIAEAELVVPVGELSPELVVTPGIFVQRVVQAEKQVVWSYKGSKK